jgi:hypothetical protein
MLRLTESFQRREMPLSFVLESPTTTFNHPICSSVTQYSINDRMLITHHYVGVYRACVTTNRLPVFFGWITRKLKAKAVRRANGNVTCSVFI